MKRKFGFILAAIIGVVFLSCRDNSFEKQRENEMKELNEYIRAFHPGETPKRSGLFYFPLGEGSGDSIKIGDRVQLFYEIRTLDSTLRLSSGRYEPVEMVVMPPTQLSSSPQTIGGILALNEALTYMKKGSKALLIFDSSLGFGQYGTGGIGGFTPVMMEVEVYKVYPAQQPEEEEDPQGT